MTRKPIAVDSDGKKKVNMIQFRATDEDIVGLDKIAKRTKRTRSGVIRVLIRDAARGLS